MPFLRSTGRSNVLAACGLAGPLVFIVAVIAASANHPGYDHFKDFISELGATGAPAAGVMNFAGFLPYGALTATFALGVHRGMRSDAGGWLGPAILAVYGFAYIAIAFAPCDPGCQAAIPSVHHRVHFLLGDVIILAAVTGPFCLYSRMLKDPAWESLAPVTLILPGFAWLVLEASGVGLSGALRQRIWLLLLLVWIALMALRLLRTGGTDARRLVSQGAA